jgi:hypothetical protein
MSFRRTFIEVTRVAFLARCPDWVVGTRKPPGSFPLEPRFVRFRDNMRQEFGAEFGRESFMYFTGFRRGSGLVLPAGPVDDAESARLSDAFNIPSSSHAWTCLPFAHRHVSEYGVFPLSRLDAVDGDVLLDGFSHAQAILRKYSDEERLAVCGPRFVRTLNDALDYALPRLDAAWSLV